MHNKITEDLMKTTTFQGRIDEEPQSHIDPDTTKRRDAFSNISRELTEADLKSPGTQRLLLRDLDNYEECKKQLADMREKFHKADRANGIYEVQLHQYKGIDYLYSLLLGIGSALVGLSPAIWTDDTQYLSIVIGALGLVAFIASLIIKHFR